jgi:hypothetical protein
MSPPHRCTVEMLTWLLWGLFLVRCSVNAWLLEPTNDEGLWLWNARCQAQGLDGLGILHAALSPGSFHLFNLLFHLFPIAILTVRLFNVLVCAGALALWIKHCHREGRLGGALLAALWWLCDPFLFRAASWAYLEPLLLLLITLVATRRARLLSSPWGCVTLGLLMGATLAVKITCVWVLGLLLTDLWRRETRRGALLALFCAGITAAGCFASVWLAVPPDEFRQVWQAHSQARISPGAGLTFALQHFEPRACLYWLAVPVTLGLAWCRPAQRELMKPLLPAILGGFAYFLMQSYVPDRYLCPLALLSIGATCATLDLKVVALNASHCLVIVAVALGVNAALYPKLIIHPANVGGRDLTRQVEAAVARQQRVAAPPHLSISARGLVVPTTAGIGTIRPPADFTPQLLIRQDIAAMDNNTDARWMARFEKAGIKPMRVGAFYLVYTQE